MIRCCSANRICLSLDIGDIGIRTTCKTSFSLMQEFAGFLSNGKPSAVLSLEVHRRGRFRNAGGVRSLVCGDLVDVYSEDGRMEIEGGDFKGYVNPGTLEAEVELSSTNSFESFLRIVYSLILPDRNGLAIHASSLVRDGKAYVFPGKSGVGKSTIVRSSRDATLLTDEISIVRGIGESPIAYGTPFHGDLEIPGENIRAPVTGLYFPVKDKENYLEELSAKAALRKLLGSVVFFGQEQRLVEKAFQLSYELVTSLSCYDLHFLPDPSFWSCFNAQKGTED